MATIVRLIPVKSVADQVTVDLHTSSEPIDFDGQFKTCLEELCLTYSIHILSTETHMDNDNKTTYVVTLECVP